MMITVTMTIVMIIMMIDDDNNIDGENLKAIY